MTDMAKTLSAKFRYDGKVRHVIDITLDDERKQFIGFEVRKSGRFSYRVKRFDFAKLDSPWIVEVQK